MGFKWISLLRLRLFTVSDAQVTLRARGSLFLCCDKVLLLKTTCQILSFTVQDTHISGTSRRVCCTCTTQTYINSSESPPGFTLLWTPLEEAMSIVLSSCVRDNGALYISSAKYRNIDKTRLHSAWAMYQWRNRYTGIWWSQLLCQWLLASICLIMDRQMSFMAPASCCWWHRQNWMSFHSKRT